MEKNSLHTEKAVHFTIFKEVCSLINNNSSLSKEDLIKIIDLAYNINKDGKRRAMSKEEYIAKYISPGPGATARGLPPVPGPRVIIPYPSE